MLEIEQRNMSNRIKHKRKSLNFTQEQFAELIGITLSSYGKIENAFQKPSLDTLILICQNLNVTLDYLVFGSIDESIPILMQDDLIKALLTFSDIDKMKHASDVLLKLSQIKSSSL